MKISPKVIIGIRNIARIILLVLTSLLFLFSLVSGADSSEGVIKGIIMNSPNAFPWLILFLMIYIAFKWELVGGILITLMGFSSIIFYRSWKHLFVLFAVSIPLIVLGNILIITWFLTKKEKN